MGSVTLAFFESKGQLADDPDEIAFDVDAVGFEQTLDRARELGAVQREPVSPNAWQRFVLLRDPDRYLQTSNHCLRRAPL